MLQEELVYEGNEIRKLREIQRSERLLLREEKRNSILRNRRLRLDEVEETFKTVTLERVILLALQLKKPNSGVSCLKEIQRAACCGEQHIESFMRVEGVLFILVGKLICADAHKRLEAASCIVNLTCGPHKTTYKIAKAAGAYLVTYILGSSCNLQDLCAWAVGNIANDCEDCFALLKAQGCLPALVPLLKSPYPEVIQSAIYALNACSKHQDKSSSDLLELALPEEILKLLCSNLPHPVIVDAVFCLSNLCTKIVQKKSLKFQEEIGSVVLTSLEKALSKEGFDIQLATALTRCLGFLSTGSDELCIMLSSHERFKDCVKSIMESQFHHLKKELLWILSNIMVSTDLLKDGQTDLRSVLSAIHTFLNPLDTGVLLALHLLCVIMETSREARETFSSELCKYVLPLLSCGKDTIEHAAQTLSVIMSSQSVMCVQSH